MKKQLLLGASSILCVVLTACGVRPSGNNNEGGSHIGELSDTKTNITIGTYDGGVKAKWLENAKTVFEDKYKETVFEEGKKGVNIVIDCNIAYNGNSMLSNPIDQLTKDIYFTESINYKALVNDNKCLDITDVFESTWEGESKSIKEKLPVELQENLKVNGKYYGVPFWDGFYGFVYDKTLFEEEKLYLDETGMSLSNNYKNNHSFGPNGVDDNGTLDDGLPATYDEFHNWCQKIKNKGITPFVYSSQFYTYIDRALVNLWSDCEGKDDFYLNYSFNGTANNLVTINADPSISTSIMAPTAITENNGYMLQRQAGKYNALDFLFTNMNEQFATGIGTHTEAQQNFIDNANSQRKYAMLIDGSWWENEAKSRIESTLNSTGIRHDFGFMPIPKATEGKIGEKATVISNCDAYGFIKKGCGNETACKEFMKFLHSDAQLKAFTKETSITRAFSATWTESEMNELTSYGKSLIQLKQTADIVYPLSNASVVTKNPSTFGYTTYPWNIGSSTSPFNYMKTNTGVSARTYFDSLYTYYQNAWSRLNK